MLKTALFSLRMFITIYFLMVPNTFAMERDLTRTRKIYLHDNSQIFYVPSSFINHDNNIAQEQIDYNCPFIQVQPINFPSQKKEIPEDFEESYISVEGLPLIYFLDKKANDTVMIQSKPEKIYLGTDIYIIRDNPITKQPFSESLQQKIDAFKVAPFYTARIGLPGKEDTYENRLFNYMTRYADEFLKAGIIALSPDGTHYIHGPTSYFPQQALKIENIAIIVKRLQTFIGINKPSIENIIEVQRK